VVSESGKGATVAIIRGVDGCKGGWLCLSVNVNGGKLAAQVFPDAKSLLESGAGAITAIDIPIGLPSDNSRQCDIEARRILGPRRSSVFPAPVRCAVEAATYDLACNTSEEACGKKLSKQTYALLPRIHDLDCLLRQKPELVNTVFEVHPEVCFYYWNNRRPMRYSKHSGFGFMERFQLVEQIFPDLAEEIRQSIQPKDASDDDILDALAALWTAHRLHSGNAVRISTKQERDDVGLPMQMWA
jgi:predicted RNase H-like nuclease